MTVAAETAKAAAGDEIGARLPGPSRRETLLVILAATLLACVYYSDLLIGGRVLLTSDLRWWFPWREHPEIAADTGFRFDSAQSYYPRRLLSREAIYGGEAPLWNPHAALGMPLLADFQTAPFYPANLLLLPLDPLTALGAFMILHTIAAGVFMYVFLRGIGVGWFAAAFGALAFQWNGYFISYMGHPTHIATGVWLPLLLFLARRALVAPRGFPWGFAIAVAFLLLAGFPQTLVYSAYALAAYGLFVLAFEVSGPIRSRVARVMPLAGAALIGAALATPQLLPAAELSRLSPHLHFTHESVWEINDIPFLTYIKALLPDFFGNPIEGTSWLAWAHRTLPHPNDLGVVAYAGVLTPLCALIGLLRSTRRTTAAPRGETLFFAGLVVIPVLFMSVEPVSRLLWLLPGWSFSTEIHRIEFLIFVALSVLAARGIEALLSTEEGRFARRTLLSLVTLLVAFLIAFTQLAERVFGGIGEQMLLVLRYAGKGSRTLWVTPRLLDYISRDIPGWVAEIRAGIIESVAVALVGTLILLALSRPRQRARAAPILLAALLLAVHAADVTYAARRYYTPQPREGAFVETEGIRAIEAATAERPGRLFRLGSGLALTPNMPGIFGLDDAGGYNALLVKEYGRYFDAIERGAFSRGREVITFSNPASLESPLFRLVAAPHLVIGGWREAAPLLAEWPFRDAARIRLSPELDRPGAFSLAVAAGAPALQWNVPGEATAPLPPGAADSIALRWETGAAGSARLEVLVSSADSAWTLWGDVIGSGGGSDSGSVARPLPGIAGEAQLSARVLGVAGATPPVRLSHFRVGGAIAVGDTAGSRTRGGYRLRYAGDLALFETDRALPRARLLTRFAVEPSSERALRRLAEGEIAVEREVLVEDRPELEIAPLDEALPAPRIVRSDATRVEIETQSPAPALLVLADLYYPGWAASVDGKPAEILRANSLFRAVAVPAGAHTVVFRFESPPYQRGCLVALAALVALPLCVLIGRRERANGAGDEPTPPAATRSPRS